MKKSFFKISIILMAGAFLIVGVLVGASIINSKHMAVEQAEKKLENLSKNYANQFSEVFSNAQLIVNNLSVYMENEFLVASYADDRNEFDREKKKADAITRGMIGNSKYPIGLYITFDPKTSKGKDEIWYVKDGSGQVQFIDSVPISEGWLVEETESTEYFFKTIREGSYWSEPTYDPGMGGKVISYTKTLYDEDHSIIGVVGTDILIDDIFRSLKKIDREIEGSSTLLTMEGKIIAGKTFRGKQPIGQFLMARAAIADKWVIEIAQPVNVATDPILKTEAAVILLGILMIVIIVIFTIEFSRRKVQPIIQEVEQKDLLMINQARQAKMGEMVGNIAHQWKQPLNSMQMAMSNMQDDYERKELGEEEFAQYMTKMKLLIASLAKTANDFTEFLKPARKQELFSANEEIENVLYLMDERIRLHGITVELSGKDVELWGYKNEFSQCMFNLLDNARDALSSEPLENRRIVISISDEIDSENRRHHHIKVFNCGSPIKEQYKDKLFNLYFTTKEEKGGSGIGLYMTKEIVETHFKGGISFENVNGGVCFDMRIPAKMEEAK